MRFREWLKRKVTPKLRTDAQREAEMDWLVGGIVAEFAIFVVCLLATSAG